MTLTVALLGDGELWLRVVNHTRRAGVSLHEDTRLAPRVRFIFGESVANKHRLESAHTLR